MEGGPHTIRVNPLNIHAGTLPHNFRNTPFIITGKMHNGIDRVRKRAKTRHFTSTMCRHNRAKDADSLQHQQTSIYCEQIRHRSTRPGPVLYLACANTLSGNTYCMCCCWGRIRQQNGMNSSTAAPADTKTPPSPNPSCCCRQHHQLRQPQTLVVLDYTQPQSIRQAILPHC